MSLNIFFYSVSHLYFEIEFYVSFSALFFGWGDGNKNLGNNLVIRFPSSSVASLHLFTVRSSPVLFYPQPPARDAVLYILWVNL